MEYFKNIREDKNSLNLFRLLACLDIGRTRVCSFGAIDA